MLDVATVIKTSGDFNIIYKKKMFMEMKIKE